MSLPKTGWTGPRRGIAVEEVVRVINLQLITSGQDDLGRVAMYDVLDQLLKSTGNDWGYAMVPHYTLPTFVRQYY